ncbi:MAG: hypothetical protein Q4B54_12595 [Coriobacteriales bacterium]|nr:hypothetical protein [Coriobacteriales bacterium]
MEELSKQRIAKISTQLQVRIPRDLYRRYGFGAQAEIVATPTGVEFRPLKTESEKCADLLESLVSEGLSGDELVERFREKAITPSVVPEYTPLE